MKVTTSKNKDFEVRCNFDKNEKCLDESTTTIEILSESEYVKFMNSNSSLPIPIAFQGSRRQFYGLG